MKWGENKCKRKDCSMRIMDMIVWVVTETIKIVLFCYGVIGLDIKQGWKKYSAFLYLLIGIPVLVITSWDDLYFHTFWGVVLLIFFFDGSIKLKLRVFWVQYIAISAIDLLIWSLLAKVLAGMMESNQKLFSIIANCPGIFFWFGILVLFRKISQKIGSQMEQMSWKYYCLILAVLLSMAIIAGGAQAEYLDETSGNMKDAILFSSAMALVLLVFVVVVFILVLFSRNQLIIENEVRKQCIEYQKRYYSELMVQDEKMRKFKHDFRKHIAALNALSIEGDLEGIQKYLSALNHESRNLRMIKTGNAIADYFIHAMICELMEKGDLKYYVAGKFPSPLKISDMDLSILLGNALDNVKEALLKLDGERMFEFIITNEEQKIVFKIVNSCEESTSFFATTKEDKQNHGFGLVNMQYVVRKYNGTMNYGYKDGRFVMKVRI